jgi:hypothetical protein
LSTTIHWDEFIAGYNIKKQNSIALDVPFLLSLSDKTLPLLNKNKALIAKWQQEAPAKIINGRCYSCYTEQLQKRTMNFLHGRSGFSWLSWNYSDAFTEQYLRKTNQQ